MPGVLLNALNGLTVERHVEELFEWKIEQQLGLATRDPQARRLYLEHRVRVVVHADHVRFGSGGDVVLEFLTSDLFVGDHALGKADPANLLQVPAAGHSIGARAGEDGVGLRPNIGMRGTSPDRSKKVTVMEDGVLISPAAYSASTAYYFPLITRMAQVRVLKGPAAILYGRDSVDAVPRLVEAPAPLRLAAYAAILGGMVLFGATEAAPFIYFQF